MSFNKKFEFKNVSKEQLDKLYKSTFANKDKNHFLDKPDMFVLEEDISHQEDINDQLNLLIEDILNNPDLSCTNCSHLDADDLANTLTGIVAVHELRTNKLWQHFKMIYGLDEYKPRRACNLQENSYDPDKKVDPFDDYAF